MTRNQEGGALELGRGGCGEGCSRNPGGGGRQRPAAHLAANCTAMTPAAWLRLSEAACQRSPTRLLSEPGAAVGPGAPAGPPTTALRAPSAPGAPDSPTPTPQHTLRIPRRTEAWKPGAESFTKQAPTSTCPSPRSKGPRRPMIPGGGPRPAATPPSSGVSET